MAYNDTKKNWNGPSNRVSKNREMLAGVKPIRQALSVYYKDRADIYLLDGMLDKLACEIRNLPSHQIRKLLDASKESLTIARSGEENFEAARKSLLTILPMMAYNTGRAGNREKQNFGPLLRFVYENLTLDSIQSVSDIEVFDKLVTCLVAYHKFEGGK